MYTKKTKKNLTHFYSSWHHTPVYILSTAHPILTFLNNKQHTVC